MGSYAVPVTLSQKIFIVKSYYKFGESPEVVQEKLQRRYRIELDTVQDVDLLDQVIEEWCICMFPDLINNSQFY